MMEPVDTYRQKLAEMRSLMDRRPGGQASALEERVAVPRPLPWPDRLGRVLSQCLAAGFVYGPLSRHWRSGALVVGAGWTPRRRPDNGAVRKYGSDPDGWPCPAAACSPFVEVVLRLAYDLRDSRWTTIGKSVGKALRLPGLAEYAVDADPKRRRRYDFDHLPQPLPAPVCVVLYRSHVVLLVDCDRVPVTHGGRSLAGLWVIGADGSFDDDSDANGIVTRRFSCQPLTCEPASARAARQRTRPDRTRLFALIGLAAPDPLPAQAPRLIVGVA